MPIVSIVLKNFRSYSAETVDLLNNRMNVILGRNGEGKSNLLRSILFVLSDKIQFNQTERNNLMHKGVTDIKEDMEVEIVVDNKNRLLTVDADQVKLTRRWTAEEKQVFLVDGKTCSKSQMASVVECLGLVYTNPYNVIQQGKITQIATMDDHQIYKLLEESTGVRKYYQKRMETLNNLVKVEKERKEVETILAELEAKLKTVFQSKEEFEAFEKDNQNRKKRTGKEINARLADLSNRLITVKQEHLKAVKEIDSIGQYKQTSNDELMEVKQRAKLLTDKIIFYSSEVQHAKTDNIQLHRQDEYQIDEEEIKRVSAREKVLKQNMAKSAEELQSFKLEYESIKQQYESLKMDYEIASNNQRGKLIEASLKAYDEDIQSKKETIEQTKKSIARIQKLIEKHPSQTTTATNSLQDLKNDIDRLTHQISKHNNRLREIKVRQVDSNRRINELQIEHQNSKDLFDRLWIKFSSRVSYLVNFELMNALKRQKVRGVYGYLIDYLNISPDVSFAYDIANKNKFFALLVQDNDVVKEVLRVNKQIKGKQVNIYTLQSLRKDPLEHRRYPQCDDGYALTSEDWLKIELPESHRGSEYPSDLLDNIRKLVNNILCKYMLVKDYSVALTYAKEYHINCITAEQEIVYADAFLCRVGREEHTAESRLLAYQKLFRKKTQLDQLKQSIEQETRQYDNIGNGEMEVVRAERVAVEELKKLELQYNAAKQNSDYLSGLVEQKTKLEDDLSFSNKEYEKLQKNKEELTKKKNKKIEIPTNFKSVEEQHRIAYNHYNQLMEKYYKCEAELKTLTEKKHSLIQKVMDQRDDDENSKAVLAMNPTNTLNKLRRDLRECEERIRTVELDIIKLNQSQENVERVRAVSSEQMLIYEQEAEMLIGKKKELGVAEDIMEEDIDDPQAELADISNQNSIRKKYYTARDRVFFSKYANIKANYEEFSQRLGNITKSEAAFKELLKVCDVEATEAMETVVHRFQTHFFAIFQKLVPGGLCQITLQKYTEKVKHNDKTKHGLDIRVSFDGSVASKKWTTFSGGQKTIVALVLIMAVQECDPAPFYVFDEVDSALDTVYRQRIAELILEKSRKAQYFITTFKPEMTEFTQSSCNYLEVYGENRRSHVKPITQERAQQLVIALQEQAE